jgi:hypothetical protein
MLMITKRGQVEIAAAARAFVEAGITEVCGTLG